MSNAGRFGGRAEGEDATVPTCLDGGRRRVCGPSEVALGTTLTATRRTQCHEEDHAQAGDPASHRPTEAPRGRRTCGSPSPCEGPAAVARRAARVRRRCGRDLTDWPVARRRSERRAGLRRPDLMSRLRSWPTSPAPVAFHPQPCRGHTSATGSPCARPGPAPVGVPQAFARSPREHLSTSNDLAGSSTGHPLSAQILRTGPTPRGTRGARRSADIRQSRARPPGCRPRPRSRTMPRDAWSLHATIRRVGDDAANHRVRKRHGG